MARILYGVHGTGHGHAMRGLTIARKLGHHEFLFVTADDAPSVLEAEFPIFRMPNLGTRFRNYQVDLGATIAHALPLLFKRKEYLAKLLALIEKFQPDVCLTDLEFFTPRAARIVGLPCLTLDHQHIITCCRHKLPRDMWWDAAVQGISPRFIFPPTEDNLIVSFYAPPVHKRYRARVVPPILRDSVLRRESRDDGHILVYQSNSTHSRLIEILKSETRRTAYVFGYGEKVGREGNLVFMKKSEERFLDLLARASYVIQGGSHTLMGEALYLGKPILSLPVGAMLEQRFNAYYLARLGYGVQADMHHLPPNLLKNFEQQLPVYRQAIARGQFCGNDLVFALTDEFARTGKLRRDYQ